MFVATSTVMSLSDLAPCPRVPENTDSDEENAEDKDDSNDRNSHPGETVDEATNNQNELTKSSSELRRSTRVRHPPDRYGDCQYY